MAVEGRGSTGRDEQPNFVPNKIKEEVVIEAPKPTRVNLPSGSQQGEPSRAFSEGFEKVAAKLKNLVPLTRQ